MKGTPKDSHVQVVFLSDCLSYMQALVSFQPQKLNRNYPVLQI